MAVRARFPKGINLATGLPNSVAPSPPQGGRKWDSAHPPAGGPWHPLPSHGGPGAHPGIPGRAAAPIPLSGVGGASRSASRCEFEPARRGRERGVATRAIAQSARVLSSARGRAPSRSRGFGTRSRSVERATMQQLAHRASRLLGAPIGWAIILGHGGISQSTGFSIPRPFPAHQSGPSAVHLAGDAAPLRLEEDRGHPDRTQAFDAGAGAVGDLRAETDDRAVAGALAHRSCVRSESLIRHP